MDVYLCVLVCECLCVVLAVDCVFVFTWLASQKCPFSWAAHVAPVSNSVKLGWRAAATPLHILRRDKRKIQFMTIACCYSQSSECFFQISLDDSEQWRREWSECLRHRCLGVQKPAASFCPPLSREKGWFEKLGTADPLGTNMATWKVHSVLPWSNIVNLW